jgi:hypothetical protein
LDSFLSNKISQGDATVIRPDKQERCTGGHCLNLFWQVDCKKGLSRKILQNSYLRPPKVMVCPVEIQGKAQWEYHEVKAFWSCLKHYEQNDCTSISESHKYQNYSPANCWPSPVTDFPSCYCWISPLLIRQLDRHRSIMLMEDQLRNLWNGLSDNLIYDFVVNETNLRAIGLDKLRVSAKLELLVARLNSVIFCRIRRSKCLAELAVGPPWYLVVRSSHAVDNGLGSVHWWLD